MTWNIQQETGPNPPLGQVWTPHPVVDLLWRWMIRCGFKPGDPSATVMDLAAGDGRLVEPVGTYARLILNDIDPRLAAVLRQKYPAPHTVYNDDFRNLGKAIPTVPTAVGAPPWMKSGEDYLPQRYVDVCTAILRPGGLLGLVLPHWFTPKTRLHLAAQVNPPPIPGWPFPEQPVVHIYRKPVKVEQKRARTAGVATPLPPPRAIQPPRPPVPIRRGP